jgi:two-component system sensor histidine kinase KdpD
VKETAASPRHGLIGRRVFGVDPAYALTLVMIAAVTGVGVALFRVLAIGNVALLYLVPVMVAASLFGLRPGLFASIVSSLAYNFFFLPPVGTFTVSDPDNIVTLLVLLGVAFVTSHFAARARVQADLAGSSARRNAAIAGFARQLIATRDPAALEEVICVEIGRLLEVRTTLLLPSADGARLAASAPHGLRLAAIELAAAQWALDKGLPAGRGSDTLTASDWLFRPLGTADRTRAVIGVARDDGADPVRADQLELLDSLIDQASLALERSELEREMRDLTQLKERDRLRDALLSSVGHDLRTPLTAILGAVAELKRRVGLDFGDAVESIEGEALRLNRFVANLLDMARVEAGALRLNLQATDLTDAVASAVQDTRRVLEDHEIVIDVPADLPLIRVDPQLFHHILLNLLDNAGRHSAAGAPVTIQARRVGGRMTLAIMDEGEGIPTGREREIFETFRRIEGSDRAKGGTGLGLAIVKAFAEAMGLVVDAANRVAPRGACFTLHVPDDLIVHGLDEDAL